MRDSDLVFYRRKLFFMSDEEYERIKSVAISRRSFYCSHDRRGGGAGEAGNTDTVGFGGDGISNSLSGSSVTYAGGGGNFCLNVRWAAIRNSSVSPGYNNLHKSMERECLDKSVYKMVPLLECQKQAKESRDH